jgi:Sulfotransferase domain
LRLPDFIGIGPIRTGTTWLDQVFRGHLGLPDGIKETQFFGWRYALGPDWYASHFRRRGQTIMGEFGPTYFFDATARMHIATDLPRCKIICTLREPVDRIYSHYKLWRKLAIIKEPFAEAIEKRPELFDRMHYAVALREWLRLFGRERIMVLIYEDSRRDRQGYVDQICDFLDAPRLDLHAVAGERRMVAHFERAPCYHKLARRARELKDFMEVRRWSRVRHLLEPALEWCMDGGDPFPPLDPELERRLRARCSPDVAEVEDLLGRDLTLWNYSRDARRARAAQGVQ